MFADRSSTAHPLPPTHGAAFAECAPLPNRNEANQLPSDGPECSPEVASGPFVLLLPVKQARREPAFTAGERAAQSAHPHRSPLECGRRWRPPHHAMEVLLMQSTIQAAHRRGHLSRHERQGLARAEAFTRRAHGGISGELAVKLDQDELDLIDRLVRRDRTAVSSALLAIAGIGAGEAIRTAVLAQVSEAACWAQAEGAISAERGAQITRHVSHAQNAHHRVAA